MRFTLQNISFLSIALAAGIMSSHAKGQTPFIITFKDEKSYKDFSAEKAGKKSITDIPRLFSTVLLFDSKQEAKEFASNNKSIESIEEDYPMYKLGDVTPSAETTPYGIDMVNAVQAGTYQEDSGITTCIIDDGYEAIHPDLPTATGTGDFCCFLFFGCGCDWDAPGGSHGTHVAGSVTALGDNGIGVKGVIRNGLAPIHAVRVFGDLIPSTTTSNIINGMYACEEAGANVVNMSLGGGDNSNTFRNAFQDIIALRDDILFVVAAGNAGDSSFSYPASFPEVMSVASVDSNKVVSDYSQYNDEVDIAGPGEDVFSTIRVAEGSYGTYSGTSMASPHVAGVATLVWSYFPDSTADEIREALEMSAEDLGAPGRDDFYGHGLVDALAAKAYLAPPCDDCTPAPSGSPTFPPPTASPTACTGSDVQVFIQTDNYGSETRWEIIDSNGEVTFEGTGYDNNSQYTIQECIPDGCYTFTIYDSFGDGMCCGFGQGYYGLQYDGVLVGTGGSFDFLESLEFGDEINTFTIDYQGSTYTLDCPIILTTNAGANAVCNYSGATAATDCPCICGPYV